MSLSVLIFAIVIKYISLDLVLSTNTNFPWNKALFLIKCYCKKDQYCVNYYQSDLKIIYTMLVFFTIPFNKKLKIE